MPIPACVSELRLSLFPRRKNLQSTPLRRTQIDVLVEVFAAQLLEHVRVTKRRALHSFGVDPMQVEDAIQFATLLVGLP